ncbi:MAG: hypothetical protein WDA08_08480 [Weeksellaceae bacterium]
MCGLNSKGGFPDCFSRHPAERSNDATRCVSFPEELWAQLRGHCRLASANGFNLKKQQKKAASLYKTARLFG